MKAGMVEMPCSMLPRVIDRDLQLVRNGQSLATIIYPHDDPAYQQLARVIASSIAKFGQDQPRMLTDWDVIPDRRTPLPDEYRHQPLILLGNLNTNRVIAPLYARFYCADDAVYPGGNGYDLRTLVNPFGTGVNGLLLGGSTLEGVERAAGRLITYVEKQDQPGEMTLPYLREIELSPSLSNRLAVWPDARLDAPSPVTADLPAFRAIGAYACAYAWTGDDRYGIYARNCLRKLNSLLDQSYGDRHYYVERLVRAILWLSAGGLLDQEDLLRTDQLLLNMMLGQQGMWWRKHDGALPLGHRHHGKGTFEFFLTAQYLRWQANPDQAARALCDGWIQESYAYFDALAQAGFDDQDDDTTMNNLATLYWYSLGEERYQFFENGNARLIAERAVALHDNMGAAAGQSGYTEAYLNMMYFQGEATIPIAAVAYFDRDPRLKWILKKIPNLNVPVSGGRGLYYYPTFMHKFDTSDELTPEEPLNLSGMQRLPLAPYQFTLNNHPPLHIESAGHLAAAPETWLLPEGIDQNRLPFEKGFDKLMIRSGYEPDDIYLLLQGYQGGFRWQGRNRAANCIVRFSQFGHIFLIQNTQQLSPYHANGVFASDGYNLNPIPPIAEWLAVDAFDQVAISATRLSGYHHSSWTRHIFWHKPGNGFFVVIDQLKPEIDGEFSYTCTWRTLGYARLDGATWTSDQGRHRFILRNSESLETFTDVEEGQNAAAPFVLRQAKHGLFQAGEENHFPEFILCSSDLCS